MKVGRTLAPLRFRLSESAFFGCCCWLPSLLLLIVVKKSIAFCSFARCRHLCSPTGANSSNRVAMETQEGSEEWENSRGKTWNLETYRKKFVKILK
jgi:hypothetical protein